jgi:hypothetical protein
VDDLFLSGGIDPVDVDGTALHNIKANVKHADDRQRDNADESKEAVEALKLSGKRVQGQAGPRRHDEPGAEAPLQVLTGAGCAGGASDWRMKSISQSPV